MLVSTVSKTANKQRRKIDVVGMSGKKICKPKKLGKLPPNPTFLLVSDNE